MPLTISRILHAGYVFACDQTTLAFDPIFENPFSRNCHAFPDVRFDHAQIRNLKLDAVFISHFHDDHCSLESLDLLDRQTPIYLYCLFEELFGMIRALGFAQVHALQIDAPVHIGAFEIIARKALDDDVDSMFQIRAGGVNVLNVVDSWIDPATLPLLASQAPWDMVLWPFQTMREMDVISPSRAAQAQSQPQSQSQPSLPDDWQEQLQALNPRYVVPSSCQFLQEPWSWYNHAMFPITYRQFEREVQAWLPAARVVRFNPSVSMRLDQDGLHAAPPLAWVMPVGDQDLDFDYRPGLTPPATADIAQRFAALTAGQTALVWDYCRSGLMASYEDMELPSDSYFQQPRLWQLSVYDHTGAATHFLYRIKGDQISALAGDYEQPALALSWTTEIPIAKLYAGLALGESLTSMYMRINDQINDAATQIEIAAADLVDDPLIRCLFNDAFGAYQAAQLARLRPGV